MDDKEQITGVELSKILGITVQRIDQLVRGGHIPKVGKKYVLSDAVQAYCSRLRDQASGRMGESADGKEKLDGIYEAARLKAAQASIAELQLLKAKGEVISAEDVAEVWARIISAARTELMALAPRLGNMVHGLTAGDIELIEDEVRTVLEKLSGDGENSLEEVAEMALQEK